MKHEGGYQIKKTNKPYLNQVEKELKEIERAGQASLNRQEIKGKLIDEKDIIRYEDLLELKQIFDVEPSEIDPKNATRDAFFGNEICIPYKDLDKLLEIMSNETTNIKFPKEIQGWGMLPDYVLKNTTATKVRAPRPQIFNETKEEYERYLKDYYEKYGIKVTEVSPGVRGPYPHEKCAWENGNPINKGDKYLSPSYLKYIQSVKPKSNSDELDDFDDLEYDDEVYEEEKNKSKGKKHRFQKNNGLKYKVGKLFTRISSFDKHLGKDETITGIKKVIKRGLIITVGGLAALTGIFKFGKGYLADIALTSKAVITGSAIAPQAVAALLTNTVFMGVGLGLTVYALNKIRKNKKAKLEEQKKNEQEQTITNEQEQEHENEHEQEQELEQENTNTNTNTNTQTQGSPQPSPAPENNQENQERQQLYRQIGNMTSKEEIENFLKQKMSYLQDQIIMCNTRKIQLDMDNSKTPDVKKAEYEAIEKKINKLKSAQLEIVDIVMALQEVVMVEQELGGMKL